MAETTTTPTPPTTPPTPPTTPAAPLTPRTTTTPATWGTALWSNLVSLAVLLWLCLRGLDLALQARGRVAALLAMPPWWLYAATLVLAAAALVAAVVARVRGWPPDRPAYRLLPVLAVVVLAVEIFAVPRCRLPLPADEIVYAQASLLEPEAFVEEDGLYTTSADKVQAGLGPYEAPFLGRDGEAMGRWRAVVRTACAGPVAEVPAAMEPGALLYCVSADRTKAWLSFVGLKGLAGEPRIVREEEGGATLAWESPPKREPEAGEPVPGSGSAEPSPVEAPKTE